MRTFVGMSIVFLSLSQISFAEDAQIQWLSDYGQALKETKRDRMPLLIVLEAPQSEGKLEQVSAKSAKSDPLLKKYKLCRIDVTTEYGKKVAQAFRVASFPHTVVIDKTGSTQIYKNTGGMSSSQWSSMLSTYQHGNRRVVSTSYREAFPSSGYSFGGGGAFCRT